MMEGITSEAASLAGHLGLAKLICIYDDNKISIEGSTDITFTEDVAGRFKAYHWQVIKVEDGNDLEAIGKAIKKAKKKTDQPTLIMLRTHIAYGSPNKQDSADAHGAPLGVEEVRLTKQCLGCPENETFCVPDKILEHCRKAIESGKRSEKKWQKMVDSYRINHPDLAKQWFESMNDLLCCRLGKGYSGF